MTLEQPTLTPQAVAAEITEYVRATFLDGDTDAALDARSPLLEWGLLTSMNTVILLTHLRDTYGVEVPPTAITAKHLRDADAIAALVLELAGAGR